MYTNKNALKETEIEDVYNFIKVLTNPKLYENTDKEKDNDSYITFYNIGGNGKYKRHVRVKDARKLENLTAVLKRMSKNNLAISYNTFFRKSTRKSALYNIQALVIDIDYHKENLTYDGAMYFLENDHFNVDIPAPNYIEKGHNMRLIYLLEAPVYVANKKEYRNFIQIVQNKITNAVKDIGGDSQNINSYIRLPHSVNTKTGEKVSYIHYSDNVYSLQYIIDEFLPDRIEKQKKKLKYKNNYHATLNHNKDVLHDLVVIQSYLNTIEEDGHREMGCFLVRNYALLAGYSNEEAVNVMLNFNKNWKHPLIESKIISSTNNVDHKQYVYKNTTLKSRMGVSDTDLQLKTINNTASYENRKSYFHAYYLEHKAKGLSKRQKLTKKIKEIVSKCKEAGQKNKEIVISLAKKGISLSLKSVERYIHQLKVCPP